MSCIIRRSVHENNGMYSARKWVGIQPMIYIMKSIECQLKNFRWVIYTWKSMLEEGSPLLL